jgi:hypothetical protein
MVACMCEFPVPKYDFDLYLVQGKRFCALCVDRLMLKTKQIVIANTGRLFLAKTSSNFIAQAKAPPSGGDGVQF